MARRDEFDDEEGFLDSILTRNKPEHGHPGSLRRILAVTSGLAVLGVLAAVLWSTWPEGRGEGMDEANVPIIRADAEPYRYEPEDRGGMAVPNKDSTIFNSLKDQPGETAKAENLFEDSETPVRKEEVFAADESPAETPEAEPAPVAAAAPEAVPPGDPIEKLIAQRKAETEAEEKAEAKKVEAIQPAAGGNFYVQLASVKSEMDAKAKWPKYQAQFPSLSDLDLRVQKADLGSKGTFYRVQGGPLTEGEARKLCSSINSAKSGSCVVAKR